MSQAVQPPGREESAGFPLTILPAMLHICEAFVLPDETRRFAQCCGCLAGWSGNGVSRQGHVIS